MAPFDRRVGGIHTGCAAGASDLSGVICPAVDPPGMPTLLLTSRPPPGPVSCPLATLVLSTPPPCPPPPSSFFPLADSLPGASLPRRPVSLQDEKDMRVRHKTVTGELEGKVSSTVRVPKSGITSWASRHNTWRLRALASATRTAASGSPPNPEQQSRREEAATAERFRACTAPSPTMSAGGCAAFHSVALDEVHSVRTPGGNRSRGSSTHPSTCTAADGCPPPAPQSWPWPEAHPSSSQPAPPLSRDRKLAEQRKRRSEPRTSMTTPSPGRSCSCFRSARGSRHRPVPCHRMPARTSGANARARRLGRSVRHRCMMWDSHARPPPRTRFSASERGRARARARESAREKGRQEEGKGEREREKGKRRGARVKLTHRVARGAGRKPDDDRLALDGQHHELV
jgi:hypothetical protein